jgi:preprotein translocase subunit SecD
MNIRAATVASAASILAAAVLGGCASTQTLEIRAASSEPVPGGVKTAPPAGNAPLYVLPQVVLTGADVAWATETTDPRGHRAVSVRFTREGARKFNEYTKAHIDQPIAIFVDGTLMSAPRVLDPMNDAAMISAGAEGMTAKQQRELIAALNAGKTRPEGMG